jgi:hypothetical protein
LSVFVGFDEVDVRRDWGEDEAEDDGAEAEGNADVPDRELPFLLTIPMKPQMEMTSTFTPFLIALLQIPFAQAHSQSPRHMVSHATPRYSSPPATRARPARAKNEEQ